MNDENAFGIRDGEVAAELPEEIRRLALFHRPHPHALEASARTARRTPRESDAVCTIELDPRWAPALKDVETCSHLVVLYWMDRSRRDIVLQVPRHYGVQRGTFALRSPARPNPIAMSVVRLIAVEGNKLEVVGLDCLDGTPLIDLKPYFASTDAVRTRWSAGTRRARPSSP